MIAKVKRDLNIIASELQASGRREANEVIITGNLLLEAKEQLVHGKWLPWLRINFGASERSAQNYMAAARYAAKNATVADLKLRLSALYLLDSETTPKDEINAILKAAETEWVDYERASEIVNLLHAERMGDTEEEQEGRIEDAAQSESEAILDEPPLDLPPPPEPAPPIDLTLQSFDEAVATLFRLNTKFRSSFQATTHRPEIFNTVAEFMVEMAELLEKQ